MNVNAKANPRPTLDQRRAKHAWAVVQRIVSSKGKGSESAKQFGRNAKKLPTRIMTSGLGQALAFLNAKDYSQELLEALGDWVLDKRRNPQSCEPAPAKDAMLRAIVEGGAEDLRRFTDEAMAYLVWLNRFAEAEGLTQDGSD